MSSRYDPLDDTKPQARAPLSPLPKPRSMRAAVVAIVLASLVGVGGAFGFDVCEALHMVGLELDACKVTPTPEPAPVVAVEPEPE